MAPPPPPTAPARSAKPGVVAGLAILLRRPRVLWRFLWDRRAPLGPKLALVGALLYAIVPVDLIPDLIPVFGWLDDIGFAGVSLAYLARAVVGYEQRKEAEEGPPEGD